MADRTYKIDGTNPLTGEPVTEYPSVTTCCDLMDKPFLRQWAADCAVGYIEAIFLDFVSCGLKGSPRPNLFNDARTEYKRQGAEAALFGTQVHAICERYFRQKKQWPDQTLMYYEDDPKVIYTTEERVDGKTIYTDHELIWDDLFRKLYKGLHDWCKRNKVVPISIEEVVYGEGYAGRYDLVCILKDKVTMIDIKTVKQGGYRDEWKPQLAAYRKAYNLNTSLDVPVVQDHIFLKWNKATERWNHKSFPEDYEDDYNIFLALRNLWWYINIKKQRKAKK